MVVWGVCRERAVCGTGGNFPLLFTIVLDGPFRLPYLSCGEPPDNLILAEMIDRPTYVFDTISVGLEDSLDKPPSIFTTHTATAINIYPGGIDHALQLTPALTLLASGSRAPFIVRHIFRTRRQRLVCALSEPLQEICSAQDAIYHCLQPDSFGALTCSMSVSGS